MEASRSVFVLAAAVLCRALCWEAPGKLSALLGQEVTLGCRFGKAWEAEAQRSALTLEWRRLDRESNKQTLLEVEGGRARVGAGADATRYLLDAAAALRGDAALRLRNVSLADEGLYTCRVITPRVHTQTTALLVLARPSVSVPQQVWLSEGQERSVQCDIVGFYPEKVSVSWQLWNGSGWVWASAQRPLRVCTEMALSRADGTFSLRSGLTLGAAALRGGWSAARCQVEHQSSGTPLEASVRLRLEAGDAAAAAAAALGAPAIIAASCSLSLLLVMAGLLLLHRLFLKDIYALKDLTDGHQKLQDAVSVSEIFHPNIIYAEVPAQLRCSIQGAPQDQLKVRWFRLGVEAESPWAPLRGGGGGGEEEELSAEASLLSEGGQHTSVLSVCLSVSDDGSRYGCVVLWQDRSFTREVTLHVKVEASFLQISSMPQVPQLDKQLVLCCRVENFYPPDPIQLEWFRSDGQPVGGVTHFGPLPDARGLARVWSRVQLLMATEDQRLRYTCRAYHSAFPPPGYRDAVYHLNTQGAPPNVMLIRCEPRRPGPQQDFTLHLCIKDFCPAEVRVTWTKDGAPVQSGAFHAPPGLNVNGLYSTFSFLKVAGGRDAAGSTYVCRVEHSALTRAEERSFSLPHPTPSHKTQQT